MPEWPYTCAGVVNSLLEGALSALAGISGRAWLAPLGVVSPPFAFCAHSHVPQVVFLGPAGWAYQRVSGSFDEGFDSCGGTHCSDIAQGRHVRFAAISDGPCVGIELHVLGKSSIAGSKLVPRVGGAFPIALSWVICNALERALMPVRAISSLGVSMQVDRSNAFVIMRFDEHLSVCVCDAGVCRLVKEFEFPPAPHLL